MGAVMSAFIDVLRQHQQALCEHTSLNADVRYAIEALLACKMPTQHKMSWCCSHCHHHEQHPLSCGHRHCPQCQYQTTQQWLQRQRTKQLPCHYFMVTFTIPYEFRPLALSQPKALYQLMFNVMAQVIKGFTHRNRQGMRGFTAVLHTHNRRRELHPHIHVILPCGYYDKHRQHWHKGNQRFLFNHAALAKVWRAKLLDAISHHPTLYLPARYPQKWVVDCRNVGYGEHAYRYLARYLYRGVLPDSDIIKVTKTHVTFKYRDGQTQQTKTRTLPALKFLALILQHVLPKGLQRVRDYGFLHGNCKRDLHRIQALLLNINQMLTPPSEKTHNATRLCPCCKGRMQCMGVILNKDRTTSPQGIT